MSVDPDSAPERAAAWPTGVPPMGSGGWSWPLASLAELSGVRGQLRRHLAAATDSGDLLAVQRSEAVLLAFDEMASNALRHGGGSVHAGVRTTTRGWLVEVTDAAADRPPRPAIGRDPSYGGLGLYLIADMADSHGWHRSGACKNVWALLPRR